MNQIRVKYVIEDVDRHGNVRVYLRRAGFPKVRLPGPLGSPVFWDAYRSAMSSTPVVKLTSVQG
jgi:hypothetical protein